MNLDKQKLFVELLLKWNAKINLTAITDPTEIQVKHIEDSLSLLPHLGEAKTVLDLGAGGGFPGIPLAIERPEIEFTLVEATRKKVSFLQTAAVQLGLKNVQAICGRAEDVQLQKQLGVFDTVTSRATWELKDFLEIAASYCTKKSTIIAMKSSKWQQELEAANSIINDLNLKLIKQDEYLLSNSDPRAILCFQF